MKHKCWVFFLLLSIQTQIYSQDSIAINFEDEPLPAVLKKLEKKFDLRFSYLDNLIKNRKITIVSKKTTLQKILGKIQEITGFVFEKINDRYYIIKKNKKLPITICGFVLDKLTNDKLKDATIINLNQGTGTNTDAKGYFNLLNVFASDTLSISYLGYLTQKIPVKYFTSSKCKYIALHTFDEILHEIVLKEYITQGFLQKNDGTIKISPERLEVLPGLTEPDVLETLQYLPGIESPNETASGLHIRGGTPDQNLILWDGIKVYQTGHLFGMISSFNPYITDEINIYKNGAKAKYGNRVSGVIDIHTKKDIPKKATGGFGFNMTHADAFLKVPLFNKKVGFITSFRQSYTDFINTFTYQNLTKKVFQNSRINASENIYSLKTSEINNKFYFTDYNIKVIVKPNPKDKFTFSNLSVKNRLDYSALFSNEDYKDREKDNLKINNLGFLTLWKRQWNEKFSQNISLSTSNYHLNYTSQDSFDQVGMLTIKKENHIKETEVKLANTIQLGEKHLLEMGYQYSKNNVSFLFENKTSYNPESDYIITENLNNISNAFYTEYTYESSKKILLDLGMRVHHFSVTKELFFEPRINLKSYLNKNLSIGISGEIKNQPISQIIEFITSDFGLENQIWALADGKDFPVLNNQQISFDLQFKKNNWSINVDNYFKKLKGLTTFTRGFSNTIEGFSIGDSHIYGVDFLIKKRINNYNTWVSYTLANADLHFDISGEQKKYSGNFDIRHSFNWVHSLKLKNFNLSLGWKYRTGKPYTKLNIDKDNTISYDKINGSRQPVYHRLDFSGTYQFQFSKSNTWRGKIGISLLNLYNQKNRLHTSYVISQNPNTQDINLIENNQFGLGITPNLVFRASF
ncbi:carboxypeptidase-like regulatory domain-containing protein [Polaribacter porphyrae]|uniref:Secretin/TonB short N-terminal domain-containing protein n=1 Tax=Polaribacter porphyrae TaxID=1137780 RepID=A0A2S7WN04_9FLAO|nr:carboxypeptidase-like regulatory domain-containing protein [Polaribacter porphyrae]PQJ78988.1 hypothetical protein BTO18_07275 [Polaribacter porphyrae]